MEEQDRSDRSADVLIAGAGISGCLAALRLRALHPDLKIQVLEKESVPGGRRRDFHAESGAWGCGLTGLSRELFDFWGQSLRYDPDSIDLESYHHGPQGSMGVLAAGKISSFDTVELFEKKGVRSLGGASAAKQWTPWDEIMSQGDAGQNFRSQWPHRVQHPSSVVCEHLGGILGIPDVWNSYPKALAERADWISGPLALGNWSEALIKTLEQGKIHLHTDCHVVAARKEENGWTVDTRKGTFQAPTLIVAQSPWDALHWLDRADLPAPIASIATKTRPISVLVLAERFAKKQPLESLPDLLFVPAEKVQIAIGHRGDLCYQATLDYERSLDHPSVVKAVKRLKRARKKFHAALGESTETVGEHLAILPVGWAQPPGYGERRWLDKLKPANILSEDLLFCGDAYGPSYNGDNNIIGSVLATCQSYQPPSQSSTEGP